MTLRVASRAQYLTEMVDDMRPKDWDATYLVKAAKGLPNNERQWVTCKVGGRLRNIDKTNQGLAIEWFAEWASARIDAVVTAPSWGLVPIPSSTSVVGSPPDFRTVQLANE